MEQSEHIFSPYKICIACTKLSGFFSSNFTIFGRKCFEMFGKGKNYKSPSEIRTHNLKISEVRHTMEVSHTT